VCKTIHAAHVSVTRRCVILVLSAIGASVILAGVVIVPLSPNKTSGTSLGKWEKRRCAATGHGMQTKAARTSLALATDSWVGIAVFVF
jgi:hypothetical protein